MGRVVGGLCLAIGGLLWGCRGESLAVTSEQAESILPDVVVEAGTLFRGTFSPDGSEFYFFVTITEGEEDYRVFVTDRSSSGWSEPTMLALGDSSASSLYPVVSPDGELLVFTTYRAIDDEAVNANLWAAHRGDSGWSDPVPLLETSTFENYDAGPWFGPGDDLRFASTSPDWTETWMRAASRTSESFGPWTADMFWDGLGWPRATHHFWNGVLNRAGTIAVLELSVRESDGRLGNSDLWIVRKETEGWSEAEPLGPEVNTESVENFPMFTPDDTVVVYVRDFTWFQSAIIGN